MPPVYTKESSTPTPSNQKTINKRKISKFKNTTSGPKNLKVVISRPNKIARGEFAPHQRQIIMWNYVSTAHKPTSVTHTLTGNFTSPTDKNLIVRYDNFVISNSAFFLPCASKCTRIEIHLLTPDGISPLLDVGIYGRIATMELFRPQVSMI